MLKHNEIPIESLRELKLGTKLIDSIRESGITHLRSFQFNAIKRGVSGRSIIVVAPTGSGKTLIGEVIVVNRILQEKIKAFYLTPYKALSEEIAQTFRKRYPFIRIGIATGDYRDQPIHMLGQYDLLVLTYEKADHVFRENPSWLKNVKVAIVDEIHMLGDSSRGPILDIVLTYMLEKQFQIIGLSATIGNPEDISSWLNAELIISRFRPVKLLECIYYLSKNKIIIYDPNPDLEERYLIKNSNISTTSTVNTQKKLDSFWTDTNSLKAILGENFQIVSEREGVAEIKTRKFRKDALCIELEKLFHDKLHYGQLFCRDPILDNIKIKPRSIINAILSLIADTFNEMKLYDQMWQVLIFRSSRSLAQKTAKKIAEFMRTHNFSKIFKDNRDIIESISRLEESNTTLAKELADLIKYGVAFHHAGLSRSLRNIVETAFRTNKIGILVATPTLAAGVNLPARRVIVEEKFYDPTIGERREISSAEYKQRGGRAGRPGYDIVGEVFLIAKDRNQLEKFLDKYIFSAPEDITPVSGYIPPIVYSQILAIIVMAKKISIDDVRTFFYKTFFGYYVHSRGDIYGIRTLEENIIDGINFLQSMDLIRQTNKKSLIFKPTKIGKELTRLYLKPTSAKPLIDLLKFWQHTKIKTLTKKRIIETLFSIASSYEALPLLRRLLSKMAPLLDLIDKNINILKNLDRFLPEDIYDIIYGNYRSLEEEELLAKFGGTIILYYWINGKDLSHMINMFVPNFGTGDLTELVRISSWLAHCLSELSTIIMNNISITDELRILEKRIRYGVPEDLIEIVENIEGIGRVRAIALKKAGFDRLDKIARTPLDKLVQIENIGPVLAKKLKEYATKKVSRELL